MRSFSKAEVDAKEKLRIQEGFVGLWKISGEKLIDPTQKGFTFLEKDFNKFAAYQTTSAGPQNSKFYRNSLMVLYKDDFTNKSSSNLFDHLDNS